MDKRLGKTIKIFQHYYFNYSSGNLKANTVYYATALPFLLPKK